MVQVGMVLAELALVELDQEALVLEEEDQVMVQVAQELVMVLVE